MKLTTDDIVKLRAAITACKLADIELAVISEGKIRGLSESKNAAIFSELKLSIDENIQLGVTRMSELEKRLSLFGDDIIIEGELNADKKVKRLMVKAKNGKIEFRCTDVALLDRKYPKSNKDQPGTVLTFSKPEIALISRGLRTLGAEQVTLQIKRDGAVHIEGSDSSNDKFETDLSTPAEFIEDPTPAVNQYDTTGTGVLLKLLEHVAKDNDSIQLIMMKSGNIGVKIYGNDVLAIPRIQG